MINYNFYSTVDHHRLHLADENSRYIGNINCYNNFLTRFFSKMFGKALTVDFHGKMRTINVKSYIKFLKSHGLMANSENILNFANFSQVLKRQNDWSQGGFMRDFISKPKRISSLKTYYSHSTRRSNKSPKFAGQGADIEQTFWEKSNHQICLGSSLSSHLPTSSMSDKMTQLNPLFYSAKKNYTELSKFLVSIGAKKNFDSKPFK